MEPGPPLAVRVHERDDVGVRVGGRRVVEQRDGEVERPVAVVVVGDRVEEAVAVLVVVADDLLHFRGRGASARRFPAAVELAPAVHGPGTPLRAGQVDLAVEDAHVELPAAGVVAVELAAVAERVGLGVPAEARLLPLVRHLQLRVVAVAPALRAPDVDLLGAAEAVHGVVHLDALPAVVVVVLVVDEVRRLPARAEEGVVALVVGHEEELVDLAPVAPLEAAVELGVAAQGGVRLAHRAVGHARPADAAQRQVVVDLVALPRVVVEVEGQEGLVEDAREGREALVDGRHGVEPAHGHLGQAVAVRVVEGEGVLPVEARVGQRLRGAVDLQEEAVAVVVRLPVGGLVVRPVRVAEVELAPVLPAEDAVFLDVEEEHPVRLGGRPLPALSPHRGLGRPGLDVGPPVAVVVGPLDVLVVDAVVGAVAVHVDLQHVGDLVAPGVRRAEVPVLVEPPHPLAVPPPLDHVRLAVAVDVPADDTLRRGPRELGASQVGGRLGGGGPGGEYEKQGAEAGLRHVEHLSGAAGSIAQKGRRGRAGRAQSGGAAPRTAAIRKPRSSLLSSGWNSSR